MPELDVRLTATEDTIGHDDLVVRVGTAEFVCDSYYLLIGPPDAEEGVAKARHILGKLLEQWVAAVQGAPDGTAVYLPFDFSDQATRWLCVRRRGEDVEFAAGWSHMEGHKFSPTTIGDHINGVEDWQQETPGQAVPRAGFLSTLRAILEREARV